MRWTIPLALILALTACGGANSAPPTAAEPVVAEPTDVAGGSPVGSVEELTIAAADGLPIQATLLRPPAGGAAPGVILLHMLGDDRRVWGENSLAADLVAAGYAVLAVDMRGHGQTGGDADWTLAAGDLGRVWDAFAGREDVDEARTAVVGASIGANMALRLGADRPDVAAVALLSPGLDYRGVTTADQLAVYSDRPLLLVASEDDAYSADSVRALAEAAGGATVQMYENAGHGTNMLAAEPELAGLIAGWLVEHTTANP